MFEPGHLHIRYEGVQPGETDYDIKIDYEVRQDAEKGTLVHFDMSGKIGQKAFEESFELPRDMAYNFASNATRIAVKHGLAQAAIHPLHSHRQYDLMFEDIRKKLNAQSGETVKPEHLQ